MKKLAESDPETQSADLVAENVEQLKVLFPEAFTEGKVDFEVLKALLGGAVDEREEKYGLNWHGKRKARQLALTPSIGTLRPCPEESVDWDTTQNLMIEGDNLEVLKLLQKSYAGKVKLIYIDPPYNTGRDFVYHDDFGDNIRNYLELTGQIEGGRKITSNTEVSGRFHTDWLNMMYPRLKLAKTLLHHDGTIFVSINDSEGQNLRAMLDEIFGEENFVAQIVWQRSKKGDARLIATTHEYIVCYVRDRIANLEWRRKKAGAAEVLAKYEEFRESLRNDHSKVREKMQEWYRALNETDARKSHKHYNWSDDRGLYFAADFAGPDDGRPNRPRHDIPHPVTGKPCKLPSTGWRWDEAKTKWALEQVPPRIHFGPDETTIPNRKSYLAEISSEPYSSVFYRDGRSATLEVEELVGKGCFPFPKNIEILSELIELVTQPDDVILDFFAGSGSTGHAVFSVNGQLGTHRRFVLVQLPEPTRTQRSDGTWDESAAWKAGYPTIADLTKRRLARAGEKIQEESPLFPGDIGFRVFKLDSSNIRAWEPDRAHLGQTLLESVEHLKTGRTETDILYELLLKLGLDLCVPLEKRTLAGKEVHGIGGGVLFACLAEQISRDEVEPLAQGIVAWHQELAPAGDTTCVFRDSAFADDVAKTNLAAILAQHGLAKVRSL
ncbi:MAG TPA: site-specific DNA-methyltransferase [Thermoanaerobaculia bacterium]|jgi:adenine-specific DNA-methyltransferase|nr:site-specific DNA-methyltransferase [Thermoanaerobaculia bacterium]